MWKEWISPALAVLFKASALIGVQVCVWVASGLYHRDSFRAEADAQIQIRVREDCVRPEWVRTELQAEKYDLTDRELRLVAAQTRLVSQRLDDLLMKTERVEALRQEVVQSRVPSRMGGMGGPGPSKR
jgi:hypothetical protein